MRRSPRCTARATPVRNAAGYAGVSRPTPGSASRRSTWPTPRSGSGNGSTGVTQWADTSALASTWDTSLASAYGSAYGAEQAGKGHNIALMPTVNILRLPLWGRAPETFSEDPYLTGSQAAAEIRGVQSQHVIATVEALRRQQPGGAAQLTSTWWPASARCTRSTTPPSRWPSRTPASARSCVPTTGSTAPTPARTRRS